MWGTLGEDYKSNRPSWGCPGIGDDGSPNQVTIFICLTLTPFKMPFPYMALTSLLHVSTETLI